MSLIASASPWTNDDDDTPKKRTPALRKTVKRVPPQQPDQQVSSSSSSTYTAANNEVEYQNVQSMGQNSIMPSPTDNSSRVSQLINQMTSLNADNDGNRLADFQPLSHPAIQKRTDMQSAGREAEEHVDAPHNPLQIPPPVQRQNPGQSNFSANVPDLGKMASNYNMIYQPTKTLQQNYGPASISSGHGQIGSQTVDNKLMEKINYMIHMLEQQHNEKTSNITEEFVLYTFLGVFIIFIVDSFARSGKYTR